MGCIENFPTPTKILPPKDGRKTRGKIGWVNE